MSLANKDDVTQRYDAQPVMLAAMFGVGLSGSVDFVVPVPSSRLRTKISILYIPAENVPSANGSNVVISSANTLWLATREPDRSGRRGTKPAINNLFGTQAAPASIIGDGGVNGFSREFQTAADEIYGRLALATATIPGRWMLQASIEPEIGMLPCAVWDRFCAEFVPTLSSDPLNNGVTGQ